MTEEKEDPVKMHKEANSLYDSGKYKEAEELFVRTAELYKKSQNYFDSTSMLYKAGESSFAQKQYEKAAEHFMKSAELSFLKGYDRYGVSALEYARDSLKDLNDKGEIKKIEQKIKEAKKKLETSF